jgi:hypothetical protein
MLFYTGQVTLPGAGDGADRGHRSFHCWSADGIGRHPDLTLGDGSGPII